MHKRLVSGTEVCNAVAVDTVVTKNDESSFCTSAAVVVAIKNTVASAGVLETRGSEVDSIEGNAGRSAAGGNNVFWVNYAFCRAVQQGRSFDGGDNFSMRLETMNTGRWDAYAHVEPREMMPYVLF